MSGETSEGITLQARIWFSWWFVAEGKLLVSPRGERATMTEISSSRSRACSTTQGFWPRRRQASCGVCRIAEAELALAAAVVAALGCLDKAAAAERGSGVDQSCSERTARQGPRGNPLFASHSFCRMRSWMMRRSAAEGRTGASCAAASREARETCSISRVTTSEPRARSAAARASSQAPSKQASTTKRAGQEGSGSMTCTR